VRALQELGRAIPIAEPDRLSVAATGGPPPGPLALLEAGAASPDGVGTPLAFERQPTVKAMPLDGRRSLHDLMAPLALDDCCGEPSA
jgi:hypothetical protein